MLRNYYALTKPGIIYGNAITAAAGFFLAAKGEIDWKLMLMMLVGLSLVIASGCVFNNYMDRDIDGRMERTKNRALPSGAVSPKAAIIFAGLLLFLGVIALYFHTTNKALIAALVGFFVYVFLYTPLKRRTVYATLIGSIAGATPPVVGYAAVTNRFDSGALILFLILVFWQMPHFYAIAIRRIKDYNDASIPVLPITKGIYATKIQMALYIIGFIVASAMLTLFGYAGYLYFAVSTLLGLAWLWRSVRGFKTADNTLWAKKVFLFSLIVLTSLCVIIPIDQLIK
ncbi:MAG: heme o synthase [Candidatus Doudnabacteria bacterium]|nr:heme o synthase [Candidatus Doudnabacteria bacterium]